MLTEGLAASLSLVSRLSPLMKRLENNDTLINIHEQIMLRFDWLDYQATSGPRKSPDFVNNNHAILTHVPRVSCC